MTFKDAYEATRKKYNLPAFDELDREFDLAGIEHDDNPLREVRHRIQERLEFASGIVDTVCQPDPNNVKSMMESSFCSETDKHAAFALLKHVMVLWRQLTEATLLNEEKSDAELIKLVLKDWKDIKQALLPIIRKIRASWKEAETSKQDLGYLG